mgnify:CR=1 FL=1
MSRAESAGGVAVVRLVLQLVPNALARWLLAPVGVVLFLWFVPLWVGRGPAERRAGFGVALLLGLALDTALHGLFGSWDYAWSLRPGPIALATVLAAAALLALTRVPPPAAPAPRSKVPGYVTLGIEPRTLLPRWVRWTAPHQQSSTSSKTPPA